MELGMMKPVSNYVCRQTPAKDQGETTIPPGYRKGPQWEAQVQRAKLAARNLVQELYKANSPESFNLFLDRLVNELGVRYSEVALELVRDLHHFLMNEQSKKGTDPAETSRRMVRMIEVQAFLIEWNSTMVGTEPDVTPKFFDELKGSAKWSLMKVVDERDFVSGKHLFPTDVRRAAHGELKKLGVEFPFPESR